VFTPARFPRSNRRAEFSTNHCAAGANAIRRRPLSALPPKADTCSALAHVRFWPKADIRTSSKTSNWNSMSGNVLSSVAFRVQRPRTQSGLSKRGQLRKGVSRGPLGLTLFFPCKCRVWVCAPTARVGVACEGLRFFRSNESLANHFVNPSTVRAEVIWRSNWIGPTQDLLMCSFRHTQKYLRSTNGLVLRHPQRQVEFGRALFAFAVGRSGMLKHASLRTSAAVHRSMSA
jgi:hypothetical protein